MLFSQLPVELRRRLLEPHISGRYAIEANWPGTDRISGPRLEPLRVVDEYGIPHLWELHVNQPDMANLPQWRDARQSVRTQQAQLERKRAHEARMQESLAETEENARIRLVECEQAGLDPNLDDAYLDLMRLKEQRSTKLRNYRALLAHCEETLSRWQNYLREMQRLNR